MNERNQEREIKEGRKSRTERERKIAGQEKRKMQKKLAGVFTS
jgi:hypothetical protein